MQQFTLLRHILHVPSSLFHTLILFSEYTNEILLEFLIFEIAFVELWFRPKVLFCYCSYSFKDATLEILRIVLLKSFLGSFLLYGLPYL